MGDALVRPVHDAQAVLKLKKLAEKTAAAA